MAGLPNITRDFKLEYLTTAKRKKLSGIAYPFRTDGVGGYVTANEGVASLRDGIAQLILTSRGERVMRPDFGTSLRLKPFDQNDRTSADQLRSEIIETIARYEPRVIVQRLEIIPNTENHKITVSLTIAAKNDVLSPISVEVIV